ncbi:MAG: asparaginase [Pirellulaceae bacterium]
MKNICIINTGGTIGMKQTAEGLVPVKGFLAEQMDMMPELKDQSMPAYDILEYTPVLDSANMTPENWLKMAKDIAARYQKFDGFVILHGTDTMAYTSSALPFMMQGIGKPVILTGSQLPLGQVRSDARENLKTAMVLAANYAIPEVALFFGEKLLRGCRASKISAVLLDAFDSPNYLPLATAETQIEVFPDRMLDMPATPPESVKIEAIRNAEIATFRLFPGMSVEVLKNVLKRPLKALILETYGVGNGPAINKKFLQAIESATADNIVVLSCTQCRHGSVNQKNYQAGQVLENAGVISGRDITIEAAIAKLLYLFSTRNDVEQIRSDLSIALVGEMT